MIDKIQYLYFVLAVVLFSCSSNEVVTDDLPLEASTPNILLILADDMGLDASLGYNIGTVKPTMPNLQKMIDEGITFDNVWSNPSCTPTRAGLLTGKYGFKTGITKVGDQLATSETSLHKYLDTHNTGYSHAVIGKWHLSNDINHPADMGVDYYAGFLRGGVDSYYDWSFVENGVTSISNEYITTKLTNEAIDWVEDQTKPWFLWLAYNAPHVPFHLPPDALHSQGSLPNDEASINTNPLPYYMAALEAMDTEIGRLLDAMTEEERNNTIIIFVGDNGTPNQVAQEYANRRAKGSIYQGGIQVPMVVSGESVTRINQKEDALINTTDLFATIAEIAGVDIKMISDSYSFKDLLSNENIEPRAYNFSELGYTTGFSDKAIRNSTHKYISFEDGSEAFYNLSVDFFEVSNLLNSNLSNADSAIKDELTAELTNITQ